MHYVFTYSKNEKITGPFPQSRSMTDTYQYYSDNSVWKILDEKIDFIPNLDGIKLSGRAKITDVVFSAPIGGEIKGNLLVSSKFFELFQRVNVLQFQQFKAFLYKKSKKMEYILLHFWENQNSLVDFDKSQFYIGSGLSFKYADVDINSFDEYIGMKAKIEEEFGRKSNRRNIGASKLIFKDEIKDYDFFRIRHFANLFVISEKFLNELLSNDISGFDYTPINELKFKVYDALPPEKGNAITDVE